MDAAPLTDRELLQTMLALRDFRPVGGVAFSYEVTPEPGGSRVRARLWASEQDVYDFPLACPPGDEALKYLYLISEQIRDRARVRPGILDTSAMGRDQ